MTSSRVVMPEGVRRAWLHVVGETIAAVSTERPAGLPVEDWGDHVVMPGVIDLHVHVNEPGRTSWEGFATATRAAAAGGITTLVDMPLNCIPSTNDPEAVELKVRAAQGQLRVDVGLWGGAVPDNVHQLAPLWERGVLGFKCFLSHPGTAEFVNLGPDDLPRAMAEIARLDGVLLVHAEDPEHLREPDGDPDRYATYLATRPPEAELEAIRRVVEGARATGCRVHIVHLSTAEALPFIAEARQDVALTVETCPHYLTFAAEDIPDGAVEYKCAPPIRSRDNREKLWQALQDGLIDTIGTDHSPSPPELKQGHFLEAWGGISCLELLLPAVWTEGRKRGATLEDLARWLGSNPATVAGLPGGHLSPGLPANLVVWSPEASFTVGDLQHRHPDTPFAGRTLEGVVEATYLRGHKVYDRGSFPDPPRGRLVWRSAWNT